MDNQPALPPPPGQKYRSDAIGFVVIFIHFVAAYFMTINFSYELNLKYYIGLILLTPGYVLSFLIDASPRMSDFIYGSASDTFLKFFFITFSSFFYGITVSFLVSKPMLKRSVGIILTILLILSSCYLIMLVARLAA